MTAQTTAEKFNTYETRPLGKFIEAYLQNGGDVAKAAIAAGYSPTSAWQNGQMLLGKHEVSAEIARRQREASPEQAMAKGADPKVATLEVLGSVERAILFAARKARAQMIRAEDVLTHENAGWEHQAMMGFVTQDRSLISGVLDARAAKRAQAQRDLDEAKLAWAALVREYRKVAVGLAKGGGAVIPESFPDYFRNKNFGDDAEMREILDREVAALAAR